MKKFTGIIYAAVCNKNGKIYIGQTIQKFYDRKYVHILSAKKGSKTLFHRALRKHGIDNFSWYIIDEQNSIKALNEAEQFLIKAFDSMSPKGYNLTSGGKNYTFSDEMKKAVSERVSGKNNPMFGKKHSQETKKVISEKCKLLHKRIVSNETIEKIKKLHTGYKRTEETKAKMSASQLGSKNCNAKIFIAISPDGVRYEIVGCFESFCKDILGVTRQTVRKYIISNKEFHGWNISKLVK